MSRATDYLEQLGSDRRVVEPTVVDAIIGLGMVLDERLSEIHDAINTQTRVLAERIELLGPDTRDYAYTPGDRDENGETDIERARRQDDEEDPEPDVDAPPPTTARLAAAL
jgi:hypothetical protein